MNELSNQTSPYLLQHANNPVHWKAWSDTSLSLAVAEDKLIIVSVGYSACHWCHVMEHETFEDAKAAAVMNRDFISIKVDREERPDIDAVYMKAVQLMTGQGGWPMNVICLPDGRPVWGGTFFRKQQWMEALQQLAGMYQNEREKVLEYAEKLHDGLQTVSLVPEKGTHGNDAGEMLSNLVDQWRQGFDNTYGGEARAPKFPMPDNLQFLMYYAHVSNDARLFEHVDKTLTRMAWGGIFDTVGGGFSRYSVDDRWHVPHFEKMLYDNGQLLSLYAGAYKRTANPLYLEVMDKTIGFAVRELANGEGGFFSALDADSIDGKGTLEEGAFYVWTKPELAELLGDDVERFTSVFNINDFGHWENGRYVLIQDKPLEDIAGALQTQTETLSNQKKGWEKTLFDARRKRQRPRLDDKCLASWNAMMAKGLADAYMAAGNGAYLEMAQRCIGFITSKMWRHDGNLVRSYKNGKATINAYLEDYAHTISALIRIYEATFDESYLADARRLTDHALAHFYDGSGFFRYTSDQDAALVAPHYEIEDNVIPSSNSVMARNLLRLSVYFEHGYYEKIAHSMCARIVAGITYPGAYSNWLSLLIDLSPAACQLAVCGDQANVNAGLFRRRYLPNMLLAGTEKPSNLPFLSGRYMPGAARYFVCRGKTCGAPLSDAGEALALVGEFAPLTP